LIDLRRETPEFKKYSALLEKIGKKVIKMQQISSYNLQNIYDSMKDQISRVRFALCRWSSLFS